MKNLRLFTSLSLSVSLLVAIAGCAGFSSQAGTQSNADRPASAQTSDAEIVSRVKSALAQDADLKDVKIDVSSNQGAVRIKGEIKSLALRRKVDAVVAAVPGVRSVENNLIVTG